MTVKEEKKQGGEVSKPKMQVENPFQGLVWRLLMVNTLSCGLEACMAAGTVYIPPLLLQAGMEERYMTMVLGKWMDHSLWFSMESRPPIEQDTEPQSLPMV